MMKKLFRMAAIFLILAVAAVGSVSAQSDSTVNDNVIHSSGTGNVIGTPDRAQVTFSVQTENTDVKRAQSENSARMNTVIDALIASGIPRDALKTTGYNIYPVYEDSVGIMKPKVKTYRVTNTLTVTLHDVSKTGEVIDIAVDNGINQADSIRFMLSDQQQKVLRTEALKKAVDQARSDADTVA
ncbi:MAG TPA: SIMPL domain-containing protein, partial [Methanoregula sp.]|nr:SIMPL domain-containing protein [Methanoregula sp.]